VFLHELGHAFVFNGFRNPATGLLPNSPSDPDRIDGSTFDVLETFNGTHWFFNGPRATELYGGPVPITSGNDFHLGNNSPAPGSDLIPDLMNGIVFFRGSRYDISPLDLAIAADTGVSVVPEPSAVVLFAIGVVGVGVTARRMRMARASIPERG
jgi:hypothetical protein